MALREIIDGPEMQFLVLGRADVLTRAPDLPYVVISITDTGTPEAIVADSPHRLDVLRLQFHDADTAQEGKTLIRPEDADAIIAFVRRYRDSAKLIVCQCEGGISRSAGVAAALSKWLQNDDTLFFRHYLPNRLVYRTVLNAAYQIDTDARDIKVNH